MYDAVAHFNEGSAATCFVLQKFWFERGFFRDMIGRDLDDTRVYAA